MSFVQSPAPLGIHILENRAAKLAEEGLVWVCRHGPTTGVCVINPSRESVNDCLYSPDLML